MHRHPATEKPIEMNTTCAHLSLNQIALVSHLSTKQLCVKIECPVPATTEYVQQNYKKKYQKTYIERDLPLFKKYLPGRRTGHFAIIYTNICVYVSAKQCVHWLHLLFAFCKHMQISHTVRVHCKVYTHHNFNQRTRLLLLKRRKKNSCCTVIIKRDRRHDVYTKRTEREQTILIEINASPVDINNLIEYNVRVDFFVGLFTFVFFFQLFFHLFFV